MLFGVILVLFWCYFSDGQSFVIYNGDVCWCHPPLGGNFGVILLLFWCYFSVILVLFWCYFSDGQSLVIYNGDICRCHPPFGVNFWCLVRPASREELQDIDY